MDRRQLLQAIGACTVLPVWAFPSVDSTDIEKGTMPRLIEERGAVEVPYAARDMPKIGIVSVGGIGGEYLPKPGYFTQSLPYLNRTIAIEPSGIELSFMEAHRNVLVSGGKTRLSPQATEPLAQSTSHAISDAVAGLDMVLLVAGMGDHTGSGIASIVAQVLRQKGILTLGFAVMPFDSQGLQRQQTAQAGVRELRKYVDGLIPFFNNGPDAKDIKLHSDVTWPAPMAFVHLCRNIMNPVCRSGLVNIDFEDLRHMILSHEGDSAFGFGSASYQDGTAAAAHQAIDHPLLGRGRLQRASAVLVAVGASPLVLKLKDSQNAIKSVRKQLSPDACVIYGIASDSDLGNEITVSILASGIRKI